MLDQSFSIARLPRIEFGVGASAKLPDLAAQYGREVLLVTGAASLESTAFWQELQQGFKARGLMASHCRIPGEPSPTLIDTIVRDFAGQNIDVLIGIGGGSALDAAKAIAALLRLGQSVLDFLEGVGPELPYSGPAVPFIAVPTTAGTGSEATKNAVLSVHGTAGFKKSFRDDRLVAQYAVLDPDLLASCPAPLIAANGMDALTQLMESYVSLRANVFTDALIVSGLRALRDGLLVWYRDGAAARDAAAKMAYAALISGIALAQTGLGSVHGLASPLGAFYPIPHGVVCGTLVAEATRVNIQAMLLREPENIALERYARLGEILNQRRYTDQQTARDALLQLLTNWTKQMRLPRLAEYGIQADRLDHVIAHSRGSSMRTNPIVLLDEEIRELLLSRL